MQNAPIDAAVGAVAGTVAGIKSTEFWVTAFDPIVITSGGYSQLFAVPILDATVVP